MIITRKYTTFTPPADVKPKKNEKLSHEYVLEFERQCKGYISFNENMKFSKFTEWYFENYAPIKWKVLTVYTYT